MTTIPDGTGTSRGAQQEKEVPSKPPSLTGEADPSGATADAPSMGSNTRGVIPAEMATTRPPEEKPEAKNSDSMAQPEIKNDFMKATASEKNAAPVKKDEDIYAEAMRQLEALLAEMKKQQNNDEK